MPTGSQDPSIALPDKDQVTKVEQKWPSYTYLLWSSNGEVNLTAQTFEVKIVVRKAIPLMIANVIFVDGYPDQPTRSAWSKKALVSAAGDTKTAAERNSQSAATHYDAIRRRLKREDDYWRALAKLVSDTSSRRP